MGRKSSPSPPPAPDPTAVANAQTQSNQSNAAFNAVLNRPNINTPYGNQTWVQNGTDPATGAPLWTQNINVSGNAQTAIDNEIASQAALSGLLGNAVTNIGNTIGSGIDPSTLPGIQTDIGSGPQVGSGLDSGVDTSGLPQFATQVGSGNLDDARAQAQQAIYAQHSNMLDPQYQQQQEQLDSQLANQGIMQGSKAYNDAQNNFARQRDYAYGQARNAAITGGNDYAQQQFQRGLANANLQNSARSGMFGEGVTNVGIGNQAAQQGFGNALTGANFGNQANQQWLSQLLQLHNQPLNELSALRSGSQVQTPSFQPTPAVMSNPTDIAGITQQGYLNSLNPYNAQMAQNNGITSGLFGLGSAFLMSDMRVKKNITPIGKTFGGENLYKYEYKGSNVPQIGVMAQEVMQHKPEAVARHPSGMFMVDYSQVQ